MTESIHDKYITIAKIILKNHPKFNLEENYKESYCNIDEECDKPYTEENCNNCKERMYRNYDIAILWGCDGVNYEYELETLNFHGEEDNDYCILTEKHMYEKLEWLNNHLYKWVVGSYKRQLEPYQKIDELKVFAKDFFITIKNDFKLLLNPRILPIEFCFKDEDLDDVGEKVKGNFYYAKNTDQDIIQINIFNDQLEDLNDMETMNELKTTIKHEVIHYSLFHSFLKFDDADAVFHVLCKLYDAGAYMPMKAKEQKLYDNFMYIYQNAEELIPKHSIKESKEMLIHYMLRYIGHIPWNVNQEFLDYAEPLYTKLMNGCELSLPA